MLYEVETHNSIEQIDLALRAAANKHQFGVLGVHDLQDALAKKGVTLGKPCLVYEVCNPHQAKKALDINAAFSSMLPCRISVYGTDHGYRLSTVLPTALGKFFAGAGIEPIAREVENDVKEIMQEAVR